MALPVSVSQGGYSTDKNQVILVSTENTEAFMTDNILRYESEIWATADLLRGCGIKESE
jgi:uncharacterized membrane protein